MILLSLLSGSRNNLFGIKNIPTSEPAIQSSAKKVEHTPL